LGNTPARSNDGFRPPPGIIHESLVAKSKASR
jgi:hypothetical protein